MSGEQSSVAGVELRGPLEGPLTNPLHPEVPTSPLVVHPRGADSPELGTADEYPCILTTGFLHEMWGGGAMSRRLGPLVELSAIPQPDIRHID